jgi:hypothetical protein
MATTTEWKAYHRLSLDRVGADSEQEFAVVATVAG